MFRKKVELDFEHSLCWPRFCPNRVIKKQFLKVLVIFSELQYYNISYRYLFNFLIYRNENQQKNKNKKKKIQDGWSYRVKFDQIWPLKKHKQSNTYLICLILEKSNDENQELLNQMWFLQASSMWISDGEGGGGIH